MAAAAATAADGKAAPAAAAAAASTSGEAGATVAAPAAEQQQPALPELMPVTPWVHVYADAATFVTNALADVDQAVVARLIQRVTTVTAMREVESFAIGMTSTRGGNSQRPGYARVDERFTDTYRLAAGEGYDMTSMIVLSWTPPIADPPATDLKDARLDRAQKNVHAYETALIQHFRTVAHPKLHPNNTVAEGGTANRKTLPGPYCLYMALKVAGRSSPAKATRKSALSAEEQQLKAGFVGLIKALGYTTPKKKEEENNKDKLGVAERNALFATEFITPEDRTALAQLLVRVQGIASAYVNKRDADAAADAAAAAAAAAANQDAKSAPTITPNGKTTNKKKASKTKSP